MAKTKNKKKPCEIPGWFVDSGDDQYEIGIDPSEKRSGTASAYIKSTVAKPKPEYFGNLCQWFDADEFRGQHLKMSAWVKTELDKSKGSARLWVRVDGEGHGEGKRDCFDNMNDRPIVGETDWQEYSVVVDVPETSSEIYFGCMLAGSGELWLDNVSIEAVSRDVPLTGKFTENDKKTRPVNLNFEDSSD